MRHAMWALHHANPWRGGATPLFRKPGTAYLATVLDLQTMRVQELEDKRDIRSTNRSLRKMCRLRRLEEERRTCFDHARRQ